jgi:hypothetical protein
VKPRWFGLLCDALALGGAVVFCVGLYRAYPPLAWLFGGVFLFWAGFVLRGRT